jgi:golgi phosphoprotein 3
MSEPSPLRMYEEIALLSLHDEKGNFQGSMHAHALAGAVVTELVLLERLHITKGSRKRTFLEAGDPTPTGDPVLDGAVERVAGARRRGRVSTWVGRLASQRKPSLREGAALSLVERGLLVREEGRVLGIFRRVRFPMSDGGPEAALIERLRIALDDNAPVPEDPRSSIILALAQSAGILGHVFEKSFLRSRKERLAMLAKLDGVPGATREAIQAAQAAVMAATMAATVAATS